MKEDSATCTLRGLCVPTPNALGNVFHFRQTVLKTDLACYLNARQVQATTRFSTDVGFRRSSLLNFHPPSLSTYLNTNTGGELHLNHGPAMVTQCSRRETYHVGGAYTLWC